MGVPFGPIIVVARLSFRRTVPGGAVYSFDLGGGFRTTFGSGPWKPAPAACEYVVGCGGITTFATSGMFVGGLVVLVLVLGAIILSSVTSASGRFPLTWFRIFAWELRISPPSLAVELTVVFTFLVRVALFSPWVLMVSFRSLSSSCMTSFNFSCIPLVSVPVMCL